MSIKPSNNIKAYVLKTSNYKENSLLVDVFSLERGRLSLLANGAKNIRSSQKAALQSFIPLNITFTGKEDSLKVIRKIEEARTPIELEPLYIYIGLYVNELLALLFRAHECSITLFGAVSSVFSALELKENIEYSLRFFEYSLLSEIGCGVDLQRDSLGNLIDCSAYYDYVKEVGLVKIESFDNDVSANGIAVKGSSIIQFRNKDLSNDFPFQDIKKLMTKAVSFALNGRTLVSRELLLAYLESTKI